MPMALSTDFPPVAVGAMQDVVAPLLADTWQVGELVDQAGGDE